MQNTSGGWGGLPESRGEGEGQPHLLELAQQGRDPVGAAGAGQSCGEGPITTKEQVQTGGACEHIVSLKGFCSIDALHLECCPCASQERALSLCLPLSSKSLSLPHSLSFPFLLFISWSPPSPSLKARGCQHLSPCSPHLPPLQGLLSCIRNVQWIFFL